MLCISCHFIPLKSLTLRADHAKLLDVLTSLPVSHALLPRDVCFATSRPANHAICSFIDSSRYASGPIRMCLFIDNIMNIFIIQLRKRPIFIGLERSRGQSTNCHIHWQAHAIRCTLVTNIRPLGFFFK